MTTRKELVSTIMDLLEAFDSEDYCDCGGAPTCPVCNAHKVLERYNEQGEDS